jgi:hypothetical protein
MRNSLNVTMSHRLAIPVVMLTALAGCVWAPDSKTPTYNEVPYYTYAVHRIAERSILGVESIVTIVTPQIDEDVYAPEENLQFILVNGDTAYRHPVLVLPPVFDSSAPYHIDGTANFVTLVFPTSSIIDTSYVTSGTPLITAPAFGDTIVRASDGIFGYQTNTAERYSLQVTDSIHFYSQFLDSSAGFIDFPATEMETFQQGTMWADLNVYGIIEPGNYDENYANYEIDRNLTIDRIVAYTLR